MRLVWRKRFGFSLVCYPIEGATETVSGFKAGIFDSNSDMWWFSDETADNSKSTQTLAYEGWVEILKEFISSGNIMPDGTDSSRAEDLVEINSELRYAETKASSPTTGTVVIDNAMPTVKEALKKVTSDERNMEDDDGTSRTEDGTTADAIKADTGESDTGGDSEEEEKEDVGGGESDSKAGCEETVKEGS